MAPDDGGQGGGADTGGGGGDTGGGGGGAATMGGGEGQDNLPWFSPLPDDLKSQMAVTRHASLTDFANAAVALEKRMGAPADQLLRVPTKPEEMDGFLRDVFKRAGAPEKADGYQLSLGEAASDDDKAMGAKFAAHMFEKTGAPPGVLQAAVDFWLGETKATAEAEAAAQAELVKTADAALRTEWGAAYEQNKTAIGALVAELGGEALVKELDLADKMGSSPELAKFLLKVANLRAESPGTGDSQRPQVPGASLTPAQALEKRTALELDPVKMRALMDASDPMHAAIVNERRRYLAFESGRNPDA